LAYEFANKNGLVHQFNPEQKMAWKKWLQLSKEKQATITSETRGNLTR